MEPKPAPGAHPCVCVCSSMEHELGILFILITMMHLKKLLITVYWVVSSITISILEIVTVTVIIPMFTYYYTRLVLRPSCPFTNIPPPGSLAAIALRRPQCLRFGEFGGVESGIPGPRAAHFGCLGHPGSWTRPEKMLRIQYPYYAQCMVYLPTFGWFLR